MATSGHSPMSQPGDDTGSVKRRRARIALAILIPVVLALWGLVGHSAVLLLNPFRLILIANMDGWAGDVDGIAEGIPMFIFGIVGASLLGTMMTRNAARVFSTFKSGATVSPAIACGGIAVGLLLSWFAGQWTPPPVVGRVVSDWQPASDWGAVAWTGYHVPWVLPVVFAGAGLVELARFMYAHSSRRMAMTKTAEIKEHGVRMFGTITEVRAVSDPATGVPRFDVSVSYVGKFGPRQVTERFTPRAGVPVKGGQVNVWYDPLGEDGVVLVELIDRSFSDELPPGMFPYPA